MRVPRFLLRERITVEEYRGAGPRGAAYNQARVIRAQVQPTSRATSGGRGTVVSVDANAIIRPEDSPVPVESRVTWRGQLYRVAQEFPMPDSRRPSHIELSLVLWS